MTIIEEHQANSVINIGRSITKHRMIAQIEVDLMKETISQATSRINTEMQDKHVDSVQVTKINDTLLLYTILYYND